MKKLAILCCLFSLTISTAQSQLLEESNFTSFWDGRIQPELDNKNIAGVTVTMIQGGDIVFQKGYGYADLVNNIKMDGEKTMFRVASISKLFTWVAMMQLYEEGKLSLDDEITKYLPDLQIPNHYPQKITIKHLMSHAAGFEDEFASLLQNTPSSMRPLVEVLKKEMPSQVRPPATYSSYSNHGTGMAAHIVENITKMNFYDYVEQEILTPLGMNHSTFRQPIPQHLTIHNSKGYKKVGDNLEEQTFEFVPLYPVGGASISGGDMAKFMQMFLNHGRLGNTIIMDSTISQLMTTPSHQHHPLVNPMRHGLMDMSQNGLLIYGHGGDLFYHHSTLALIPEQEMGVFISINTNVSFPGLHNLLFRDFIDTFFPEKVEPLSPSSLATLAPFKGSYAINRYSHDDIFKLGKLAMGHIEIATTTDGFLKTSLGDEVYKWAQQDELVFRHTESSEVLVFEKDNNGKITHALIGGMCTMALDKLEGVDTPLFHLAILGISLLTCILTLGYCFFTSFSKRKGQIITNFPTITKRITAITLGIVLLFYAGLGTLFSIGETIVYGFPDYTYILFSLPFLIMALMSVLGYQVVKIWVHQPTVTFWKKGAITFIWVCLAVNILQWNYWNLIGFNFY